MNEAYAFLWSALAIKHQHSTLTFKSIVSSFFNWQMIDSKIAKWVTWDSVKEVSSKIAIKPTCPIGQYN